MKKKTLIIIFYLLIYQVSYAQKEYWNVDFRIEAIYCDYCGDWVTKDTIRKMFPQIVQSPDTKFR